MSAGDLMGAVRIAGIVQLPPETGGEIIGIGCDRGYFGLRSDDKGKGRAHLGNPGTGNRPPVRRRPGATDPAALGRTAHPVVSGTDVVGFDSATACQRRMAGGQNGDFAVGANRAITNWPSDEARHGTPRVFQGES